MSGFLFTPTTRFYAEALAYMNRAGDKTSGADGAAGGFAGVVQEKLEQGEASASADGAQKTTDGVYGTGERNEQAVRAMTMEQYKQYIYQKISALPTSPTQKWDAVSVNISEEGFEAMKADPAYEKWVLDTLRSDFSYHNPWSAYAGGSYRIHYFGATKEEYRGESFSMGFRNGGKHTDSSKKKSQKSFWEKRAERHKLYLDLAQKAWYKRENEREYQEQIAIGRKEVSSAILRQQAMERTTGERVALDVNQDVLSEAATEFAQNYVFFKIPSVLTNAKAAAAKKLH
ncbi:MAG: hypothetical protein NC489_31575 [Ruminococcus flavefaciens]|nr:hypothetical protein [Ruminococcus flavefaciens]